VGVAHVRSPGFAYRGERRGTGPEVTARSRFRALAPALLLLLALLPSPARAHQAGFSQVTLHWTKDLATAQVTVHRVDAAGVLGLAAPESLMHPELLAREAEPLARYLERGLRVSADGHPLALVFERAVAVPEKRGVALAFAARASHPIGRLELEARLFPRDAQHETFLDAWVDGRLARQEVLTAARPGVVLYERGAAGWFAVARTFVAAGVHHIFIGPDHIAFIIGLMLLGGGLARVLKVATAFTLAHSITLALAATGALNVPSRIVEPLIAASIVYVGIENLRTRARQRGERRPENGVAAQPPRGRRPRTASDHRVAMAFGFGLVHGLGFASVLGELGLPREALALSLVAFNIGVELGQACIILAVTPALGLLRARRPRLAWAAVAVGSCGIIAAGGFWLVQRVLAAA
jgi:hypothetical protein